MHSVHCAALHCRAAADCCAERLDFFQVELHRGHSNVNSICGRVEKAEAINRVACGLQLASRVRITLYRGVAPLTLCEVQVYGTASVTMSPTTMVDVGAPKLSEKSTAAPRPIRRIAGEWVVTCADNAAESELVADPRTSLNGAQTFTRFRAMEIRGNVEHDLQSTTPVRSSHQCDRWPFKLFLDLGAPYTVREVAILTRKRELEGVGYSGILIEVASYNETTTWPGVFHEVYRNEAMFGSTSGDAVEFNRTEPSYKLGEFFAHAFSAVANIRFVRISFGWAVQVGGKSASFDAIELIGQRTTPATGLVLALTPSEATADATRDSAGSGTIFTPYPILHEAGTGIAFWDLSHTVMEVIHGPSVVAAPMHTHAYWLKLSERSASVPLEQHVLFSSDNEQWAVIQPAAAGSDTQLMALKTNDGALHLASRDGVQLQRSNDWRLVVVTGEGTVAGSGSSTFYVGTWKADGTTLRVEKVGTVDAVVSGSRLQRVGAVAAAGQPLRGAGKLAAAYAWDRVLSSAEINAILIAGPAADVRTIGSADGQALKAPMVAMDSLFSCARDDVGSGWELVRRVHGHQWHPATDNLQGTAVYGDVCESTQDCTFSVEFTAEAKDFDDFLFATGDCTEWLIAPKASLTQKGDKVIAKVFKSSLKSTVHPLHWRNRDNHPEDPLITLADTDTNPLLHQEGILLYAENAADFSSRAVAEHGGFNVFIRKRVAGELSQASSNAGAFTPVSVESIRTPLPAGTAVERIGRGMCSFSLPPRGSALANFDASGFSSIEDGSNVGSGDNLGNCQRRCATSVAPSATCAFLSFRPGDCILFKQHAGQCTVLHPDLRYESFKLTRVRLYALPLRAHCATVTQECGVFEIGRSCRD